MQNVTPFPTTGFVRLQKILDVYPVSRSSWWAGVKSGRYPPSVKLGPRTTAWRAESIYKLIQEAEVSIKNADEGGV